MRAAQRCGYVAAAVLAGMTVAACSQEADADPTAGSPITDQGNDPGRLEVRSDFNDRSFVPTELAGEAGGVFTVRFANVSKEPHSWVLVRKGDEQAALAEGGGGTTAVGPRPTLVTPSAPGEASAVPVPVGEAIANSGGAVEPDSARVIQVVKPEAGDYTYLCTIPGHAEQGMRGTLTVR